MTRALIATLGLIAFASAQGCGDDSAADTGTDDAADVRDDGASEVEAGADVDADADAADEDGGDVPSDDGGGETVVLNVVNLETGSGVVDVVVVVQTSTETMSGTTDGDGNVSFDGVDFAGDPPTISFFKEGFTYVTYVGVDRTLDGSIGLTPLAGYSKTDVSGTVSGLGADEEALVNLNSALGFVEALTISGDYEAQLVGDSEWSELVGQALAFDTTTGALANYVEGAVPFVEGTATDFDFALPSTPAGISRATVTLAYPVGFDSFPDTPAVREGTDAIGFAMLSTGEVGTGKRLGMAEGVAGSTSPLGVDVTVGWVTDLAGTPAADVDTTYSIPASPTSNLVMAIQNEPGVPTEGATIDVLDPPVMTTPATPTTRFSVGGDTAEWTVPGWSSFTVLELFDFPNEIWNVIVPKSVTSFRFPAIPETFAPLPSSMYFGIEVRGWEGAPDSPYELFADDTFDGRFIGQVWDVRYSRAGR